MNAVAKVETKPSLIAMMAAKRSMDPEQFAKTVRATVMPAQHTNEQFAALMLVASKYDLDPILKEIYAFPAKGGGIVPIVSIDGWLNLMNSHPAFDGMETEFTDDADGNPISCTCKIYRKDRSKPIIVTEYLAECIRQTEPWKMRRRMLRHKSVIQCNRYAFGFSGIYDEDEGEKIAEMRDITPASAPVPPRPPVPPSAKITAAPAAEIEDAEIEDAEIIDQETGEVIDSREIVTETGEATDALVDESGAEGADYFARLKVALAAATNAAEIAEVWADADPLARFEGDDEAQAAALSMKRENVKRVSK